MFIPVCHAVQHAHQKGIIHRDLKPSNVLVAEYDGRPVAKVIDFGVAKAIYQPLTEMTMFTCYGQLVGTFEYMSPEQSRVNQLDVDTRADIYGLGVLLYELLTGTTPFSKERLRSVEWDEMLRIIREEDPPIPSTRLSETARVNSAEAETLSGEPARISRVVRGEIDWIVMKALEKDRDRRYSTAEAMANDIGSFLKGGPVAACPPTLGYRLTKFARRNRSALITTSLVFISLVAGLIGTTSQAYRAKEAEAKALAAGAEALKAAEDSDRMNRYLRNDLLGLEGNTLFFDPKVKFDPELKLVTLLQRAKDRLETGFADQPKERALVQFMLVQSFCSIGKYDVASELLHQLVDRAVVKKPEGYPGLLAGKSLLVQLELLQSHWQGSIPLLEDLLKLKREVYGAEHEKTRNTASNLAVSWMMIGEYQKAEKLFQFCYDASSRKRGLDSPESLNAKHYWAIMKGKLGQTEVAEKWLREVATKMQAADNADVYLSGLGQYYMSQTRFEDAQGPLTLAFDLQQDRLEKNSSHTVATDFYLATIRLSQGELEPAKAIRNKFVEYFGDHPKLVSASIVEHMEQHAQLLLDHMDATEAERLLRLASNVLRVNQIDSSKILGKVHLCLGSALFAQGRLQEAETELQAGYENLSRFHSAHRQRESEYDTIQAAQRLAHFYKTTGDSSLEAHWQRVSSAANEN